MRSKFRREDAFVKAKKGLYRKVSPIFWKVILGIIRSEMIYYGIRMGNSVVIYYGKLTTENDPFSVVGDLK